MSFQNPTNFEGEPTLDLRDIMSRDVEVVSADASLRDAARKMKELDVGLIPVCDGDRLNGVLTDRDITSERRPKALTQQKPR
jgi:CBS domain-containing protein